jgi:hypothetical protein
MSNIHEALKPLAYIGTFLWLLALAYFLTESLLFYFKESRLTTEKIKILYEKTVASKKMFLIILRFAFAVSSFLTIFSIFLNNYSYMIYVWSVVGCAIVPTYFIRVIAQYYINQLI